MSPQQTLLTTLLFCLFCHTASAFNVSDADYTTSADITTTNDHGLNSTLSGSLGSPNSITNNHIITTGNSGTSSGDYGIKLTGQYLEIFNHNTINTTGNSGRGISINELSTVINSGSITTQGSTAYGIYAYGNDNIITNDGSITTNHTTNSYGIYINDSDNNIVSNTGSITSKEYGMYFVGDHNQISNSGTITTTDNSAAHGIFVSAASKSDASASNYSTVDNSGSITSNAHGIYTKDSYIHVTNSGTITSSDSTSDYAIANSDNDYAIITNSGTLNSTTYGIYNSGTHATITNLGTINGGVYTGDATFNILGGTISGEVNGASLAVVNIGSDSTAITFNQTANFNDLDTLTIYDNNILNSYATINANQIYLHDNATLTLYDGFAINSTITGQNSNSGTIIIAGTNFSSDTQIGSASNKIANLNLIDGASFSAQNDLYVSNITINHGTLHLDQHNNLTLHGDVTGSGLATIALGTNSQIISGNLTLSDGDHLSLTLADNHGNISSNIANISSNAHLDITTNFTESFIENNSRYTIITSATGTINAIKEDNITINNSNSNRIGLLTYHTLANTNSLDVIISRLNAAQATSNKNSQQIYHNIFNEIKSDASNSLFHFMQYLDNTTLSQAQITFNLNQLAPHSTKAFLATNRDIFSNSSQLIHSHLSQYYDQDANGGLWMQAFNARASQDQIKDDEGYDLALSGFIIGHDILTNKDHILGASLAYVSSQLESGSNLKNTQIDSFHLSFYNNLTFKKFFLNHILALTYNQYSANKTISSVNQKSIAHFNGQAYSTQLNAGFNHDITTQFSITPQLSATFITSNIDGYQEQGANSLNLNVNKISANFLELSPSLKFSYHTQPFLFPEFNKITTNITLSYAKAIINDAPTTISHFANQSSSFNNKISNLDNDSIKINGEMIAHHIDNIDFSTSYHFEKRTTYQSHALFITLHQNF